MKSGKRRRGGGEEESSPSPTTESDEGAIANDGPQEDPPAFTQTQQENDSDGEEAKQAEETEEAEEAEDSERLSEFERKRKEEFQYVQRTGVKPSESPAWTIADLICLADTVPKDKLTANHKDIMSGGKDTLCRLCVDEGKCLGDCLRKSSGKASNVTKHWKNVHQEHHEAYQKKEEEKKKKKRSIFSNVHGKKIIQPNHQSNMVTTPLLPPSKTPHKDKFENLLFIAFNDNGLATRNVEKDSWRNLLDYALYNGKQIRKEGYRHMGRVKYFSMQLEQFDTFSKHVTNLIAGIDKWYTEHTGARQEYITVSHDVWDGKNKEVLGETTRDGLAYTHVCV